MRTLNLLTVSGSLRRASCNSRALAALQALAPDDVAVHQAAIDTLPLFNPDLEEQGVPAVSTLKHAVHHCDGIIIASPEYAHGISGPMKNTLDWLVSDEQFPGKKLMLINTSPRANHAQSALKEVLRTMSGDIIEGAYVSIPLLGSNLNTEGILATPALTEALSLGLGNLCEAIRE